MRSRSVLGHYEPRIVLAQGDTDVNGPHQGAWIDSPAGDDWFVHFQDRGAYGRVVHLQPMKWGSGDWPVIGSPDGTPVPGHRKPTAGPGVPYAPPVSDTFPGGVPGPQWTWPANPAPGWRLPRPSGDGLRLACVPWPDTDLREVPNVLGQRLPAPALRVTTDLRLTAGAGTRAGLLVHGHAYAWIGLDRRAGATFLTCRAADVDGSPERDLAAPVEVPADAHVRLEATVGEGAVVRFAAESSAARLDVGTAFTATPGGWIGATLALFATARPGHGAGHADFGSFQVT
jgi:hypothetical protein